MLMFARSWAARRISPIAAGVLLALPLSASGQDVAQLAPPGSFLVVSVPKFAELASAFERSDLGKLWAEPEVRRFIDLMLKDQAEEFSTFLEDLNIEVRDLQPPTGQAGLALFLPPRAEEGSESGEPHTLAIADMGEHADDWEEALERLIDHGLDEKHITTEEDSYGGVTIRVIKPIYEEVNIPVDEEDEEEDYLIEEETGGLAGFLGGSLEDPRQLYFARVGDAFIACTDLRALESAIDELGGKATDSVADSQTFADAAAMRSAGDQAYAVFFPAPLFELISEDEDTPFKALQAIGITDVKAVSLGMRLDTADATMEMSMGVLVPQRRGILALLVPAAAGFEPPPFIPANASEVGSVFFDFSGIPDLYRAIAATMPAEQEQQMLAGFEQISNILVPTLEAMGPGINYMTVYSQPLSAESEMQIFAIDLKDQTVVANTMTFLMGAAGGMLEARDFEGNTIYSGQGAPIAVGIGFNRAFVGSPAGVENAMRLAGSHDGAARITEEPSFRDAVVQVSPGGIGYTYADMEQTLRWAYWSVQNEVQIMEQQFREFGWPEEELQEFLKEYRENRPKWLDQLPSVELLARYIGDVVSEMHATPQGIRVRSLLLKPSSR